MTHAVLELRRYETLLLRDKAATDRAQVPADGATLKVYFPSATANANVTVPDGDTLAFAVLMPERLQLGDTVQVLADPDRSLNVVAIAAGLVEFGNNSGADVSVTVGEPLFVVSRTPVLYHDALRTQPVGSNAVTADANGRVACYSTADVFDVVATGGGLTAPRIHRDQRGGRLRGGETWRNVLDYAGIQAAIDSLPAEGGVVFIPAGEYTLTQTLYTPCDRPTHLLGEGSQLNSGPSTVLQWTAAVGMLRLRGDHSTVRGLSLKMTASGSATAEHLGYGIHIGRRDVADGHPHPGTSATDTEYVKGARGPLKGLVIEDVHVREAPGWGLMIPGDGEDSSGAAEHGRRVPDSSANPVEGGTLSFWVELHRVRVSRSRRYGAFFSGGGCTTVYATGCAFLEQGVGQVPSGNLTYYAYARRTEQLIFRDCTFEGLSQPQDTIPWVRLVGMRGAKFEHCWFENDPHGDPQGYTPAYFIHLSADASAGPNRDVSIRDTKFIRAEKNKGLLRILNCDPSSVIGLQIDGPEAVSSTQVTLPDGSLIDGEVIVFNHLGAPHSNSDVVVQRGGRLIALDTDPGAPRDLPIPYDFPPHKSVLLLRDAMKVPVSAFTLLGEVGAVNGSDPAVSPFLQENGVLALVQFDLGGASPEAAGLVVYWGGRHSGWRLANSHPVLSTAERDARKDWTSGECILNSTTGRREIRFNDSWRLFNCLPVMTTTERDARTDWADGELMLNSSLDRIQVRYGGAWRTVANLP
jgi:hypothetical protein